MEGHKLMVLRYNEVAASFFFKHWDEALEVLAKLYEGMLEYPDQDIELSIKRETEEHKDGNDL